MPTPSILLDDKARVIAPIVPANPGWKLIEIHDDGFTHEFEIIAWRIGLTRAEPVLATNLSTDAYCLIRDPNGKLVTLLGEIEDSLEDAIRAAVEYAKIENAN